MEVIKLYAGGCVARDFQIHGRTRFGWGDSVRIHLRELAGMELASVVALGDLNELVEVVRDRQADRDACVDGYCKHENGRDDDNDWTDGDRDFCSQWNGLVSPGHHEVHRCQVLGDRELDREPHACAESKRGLSRVREEVVFEMDMRQHLDLDVCQRHLGPVSY